MVPTLLAVELLFRSKGGFSNLPHVIKSVSLFLDSSVELPLSTACKLGSIKLLDRIWDSSAVFANFDPKFPVGPFTIRKFIRTDKHYRQHQFTLSMMAIVKEKNLEMARWFADKFQGCRVVMDVVMAAAEAGAIEILQLFYDQDNSSLDVSLRDKMGLQVGWTGAALSSAASDGHGNVVWWLYTKISSDGNAVGRALEAAVVRGDIPLAFWLLERDAVWPDHARLHRPAHKVAINGRLDVLKWLDQEEQLDGAVGLVVKAAQHGHFDVVTWLVERDAQSGGRITALGGEGSLAIHGAVVNGHLKIAKYLRARIKTPTNAMQRALQAAEQRRQIRALSAQIGSYDQAQAVSSRTMTLAVARGYLHGVEWLYTEYGSDPDVDLFDDANKMVGQLSIMDGAASSGHLRVLKYLHHLQSSIDAGNKKRKRDESDMLSRPVCTTSAMDMAARYGHLGVVQWLHHNRSEGCTVNAMDFAAERGHLEVVKWLHQHRSEGCSTAAMDRAARDGHLEVVQWLHDNTTARCTTNAMDAAARSGHLHVVKWLHEHRSEGCTVEAMNGAACSGAIDVVRWLHANRTEGCTKDAMDEAAASGHLRVVQWLHRHRSEGCSSEAFNDAAHCNHFEVLLFLHYQRLGRCSAEAAEQEEPDETEDIRAWVLENYPELRTAARNE